MTLYQLFLSKTFEKPRCDVVLVFNQEESVCAELLMNLDILAPNPTTSLAVGEIVIIDPGNCNVLSMEVKPDAIYVHLKADEFIRTHRGIKMHNIIKLPESPAIA